MSKKRTVILIEDDQWLAAQYQRLLESDGFSVHLAANALDGMDVIDRYHPSVIVLDIFLPGPNGLVLLHELRSHSDLAKIPVVICTNSASDLSEKDLQAYGVHGVLDKTTMQPSDIVAAVRGAL